MSSTTAAHRASLILFATLVSGIGAQTPPYWQMVDYAGYSAGNIGRGGIAVPASGGEIVVSANQDRVWMVLQPDPINGYRQDFVSPVRSGSAAILDLRIVDVLADPGPEVLVLSSDDRLEIWNLATRTRRAEFPVGFSSPFAVTAGDIDGDGISEIMVVGSSQLELLRTDGSSIASISGVGGSDVGVGDVDGDPALEIVTTSGHVIDGVTHATDWYWSPGFGRELEIVDIDADGLAEVISGGIGTWIWCFDVDRRLPKWSLSVIPGQTGDLGSMCVADLDGDPALELVVGSQQRSVSAYDMSTQAPEWTLPSPDSRALGMAAGDCDGDGVVEILWGSGFSTAKAHLFVADPGIPAIEWTSPEYDGPFLGPFVGDFDGDGVDELVAVTSDHASSYGAPRVLVFDPMTMALVHESSPLSRPYDATDAQALDLDGDGDLELAVTNDATEYLDWQAGVPVSTRRTQTIGTHSLTVDLDGDGTLDLVVGAYSGVAAYLQPSGGWSWSHATNEVRRLAVADADRDGQVEVFVLTRGQRITVYDGRTGQQEAVLGGLPWTSVDTPQPIPGVDFLVTGSLGGEIGLQVPGATGYGLLGPVPLTSSALRGVGLIEGTPWIWSSSTAGIQVHDGLTSVWSTTTIGDMPSRAPVVHWPSLSIFVGSEFGLFAFRLR